MDYQEVLWLAVFLLHCVFQPVVDTALPGAPTGPNSKRKTSVKGEYCSKERFNATCASDEILLLNSAKFGRMHFGKCMKEDHGHVGCSADVLMHLDKRCSGRQSCSLDIQDETLQKMHPCPKELMSFLEADYSCVPVVANHNQVCRRSQPVVLPPPPGFLSSSIADRSGFGLPDCPWSLRVEPGRRIQISIYNFASSTLNVGSRRGGCEMYLSILDKKGMKNITICRGDARLKDVYISEKNTLQIHIIPAPKAASEPRRFLVSYKAVGCADLKAPPNAWSKRVKNTAFVKCNFTAATYFLTCEGNNWIGEVGNCSKASAQREAHGKGSTSSRFPYGILIVIGIGVALGVAVGIVLLMSILICFRRRKERQLRSLTTDPLLEDHPHEHDENSAQCNCGAKIYYATRAEMQRQLALSSIRDMSIEGNSDLPDIPISHYQGVSPGGPGLPMPDMCIVDGRPPDESHGAPPKTPDSRENSPPKQMQTSFITFKPSQISGSPESIYNHPNGSPRIISSGSPARTQGPYRTETPISEALLNGDSPKVTSKLLSDPRTRDPRMRYRNGGKPMEDPYGTRVPAANIYEKRLSQLPCAECAKETINANNINAATEQAAGNKSV